MRTLLEAVGLLRQQFEEHEVRAGELEEQLATKERSCRSLQRRAALAKAEAKAKGEAAERARAEQRRWVAKRLQAERAGADEGAGVAGLRARQRDDEVVKAQLLERRAMMQRAVEKVKIFEEVRSEHRRRIGTLREGQERTLALLAPEREQELEAARKVHEAELAHLRVVNGARAAELSASMQAASRRRDALRRERDDALEEQRLRLREGALLQQSCNETRGEMLQYVADVQDAAWRAEEASPYGDLLEMAMDDDYEQWANRDLDDLQHQCRQLQREMTRTHALLSQKQEESERWRQRGLANASFDSDRRLAAADGDDLALGAGAARSRRGFDRGDGDDEEGAPFVLA